MWSRIWATHIMISANFATWPLLLKKTRFCQNFFPSERQKSWKVVLSHRRQDNKSVAHEMQHSTGPQNDDDVWKNSVFGFLNWQYMDKQDNNLFVNTLWLSIINSISTTYTIVCNITVSTYSVQSLSNFHLHSFNHCAQI